MVIDVFSNECAMGVHKPLDSPETPSDRQRPESFATVSPFPLKGAAPVPIQKCSLLG
jgi:hypothetical protein